MHTSNNGPDPNLDPSKGYETRDLDPVKLLPIVFMMAVFILVASGAGYAVWYFNQGVSPYHKEAMLPRQIERPLPSSPVVQANPQMDIRQFRAQEYTESHTYWVGPDHHLHIPISRAMELVAQEGLPTRSNPGTPDKDGPNEPSFMSGQAPTASSSGSAGSATASQKAGSVTMAPATSAMAAAGGGKG